MAKGKLILICHSGGNFVTNDDGTLTYNGGEATAVNITTETSFNDVKLELSEECNLDQKTVTIKYFLPGNKKNLIVVKNDKDVKRMIDFHGDAITAEVFVMGTPGFERPNVEIQSTNKDKTVSHDNVGNEKNEPTKRDRPHAKKDYKVPTSSPVKRTRSATAVAKTAVVSGDNQDGVDDMSDGSPKRTSSSYSPDRNNRKADSDSDSGPDYTPKRSAFQAKHNRQSEIDIDVDASPTTSVKKRRHTPVWRFGANGRPTIVCSPDNDFVGPKSGSKSGKSHRKSSRLADNGDGRRVMRSGRNSSVPVAEDSDQEVGIVGDDSDQEVGFVADYSDQEVAIVADESDQEVGVVYDEYARAVPEDTVNIWKSAITGVGQEFASVNEFRAAMKKYAMANRFVYKYKKNDTIRAIGRCIAEGCIWKVKAMWVPTTKSFMIKKLTNVHTCEREFRRSAHRGKNWLVGTIKDRLCESPYLKPKEIANQLLQEFGVELSYTKIWRGIGDAREQLHGSIKESYNKLPWFCKKLVETNPGSIANLVIGENKRFKSLFVSFHALLVGFQNSCRPIIFLEATSFKSRYGETLLTANAIDGNDGFFVIAFAIVNVENDDSWHWFLEQLRCSILNLQPITFVVDKDKNLKNSVLAVFENAYVGYSIYHLLASFKQNMKGLHGPFHGDGKGFLAVHFLAAAHAVRIVGFKKSMEQIKLISSHAYNWVMQSEPEHWASSSFKGDRYNYVTKDVGESYAKLIEEYKHLPLLQKIDALIWTIIDDVEDAKMEASMWLGQLTFLKDKELEEERAKSHGLKVLISSDNLFEVREDSTHVVNVSDRSCTCMWWKERGLPCRHALAVFSLTGKSPYEFCSGYFTADAYRLTYAESIYPVPIDESPLQNPNEEPEKLEGEKEAEKEEGSKKDAEIEPNNMDVGENVDTVDVPEDEGDNVIEIEDSDKLAESGNIVVVKDTGGDVDLEKDEGGKSDIEKDEKGGNLVKFGEEHEDPNVFVLPPFSTKSFCSTGKKETDGGETDGDTKRKKKRRAVLK